MTNITITKILLCGLILLPLSSWALTPEEKGLALATEAEKRDTGWGDQKAEMVMILKNRQGQTSQRNIRIKNLEVSGDGDKSMSIFDTPRDVKGTAFLSFTHTNKADDQWLYLPALKRVKRISSKNKSGPFMGSEFAYEDISSQELDKYTYKWLRDEILDGHETYVLELKPTYKHSGYTRQIIWGDKKMYRPWKIEFYDRKGKLLKTLTYSGYKQFLNKYYRPTEMFMTNHITKKSTSLRWNNYTFSNGLTDRDFDKNALKRAR